MSLPSRRVPTASRPPRAARAACGRWPRRCWPAWPAIFVAATGLADLHPAWGFVRAFAEAGLVGGIADWFAVTALFRHPLGLPIPHTAIVPRNKDRIGDALANFLKDNFLTPSVVARRMQRARRRRRDRPLPQPAARRGPAARGRARACSPTSSNRSIRSDWAAWSSPRSPQRIRGGRDRAPARPDAGGGDHRGAARADGRCRSSPGPAARSTPTRT